MTTDLQVWTMVTSILTLMVSLANTLMAHINNRKIERIKAHRTLLLPVLSELSETLHCMLATTKVVLERKKKNDSWHTKAEEAGKRLKELYPKIRYHFWGLHFGFKTLTRLYSWARQLEDQTQKVDGLLDAANALKDALDEAIYESYNNGLPPLPSHIDSVNKKAKILEGIFKRRTTTDLSAVVPQADLDFF